RERARCPEASPRNGWGTPSPWSREPGCGRRGRAAGRPGHRERDVVRYTGDRLMTVLGGLATTFEPMSPLPPRTTTFMLILQVLRLPSCWPELVLGSRSDSRLQGRSEPLEVRGPWSVAGS